jgi:hypothetical protein
MRPKLKTKTLKKPELINVSAPVDGIYSAKNYFRKYARQQRQSVGRKVFQTMSTRGETED